jgi:Raf kinase inhibitor-like YbhB/YbcL family protein
MANKFTLQSDAFPSEDPVPERYTCDGENLSPPLAWNGPPEGTRSLALLMDDPDAPRGAFVHWVLFNLPPTPAFLPPGLDVEKVYGTEGSVPVEGVNDFGYLGYGGPCPPPGHGVHHYHLRLYALNAPLDLGTGATRRQVNDAMAGHVLGEADLVGTYER